MVELPVYVVLIAAIFCVVCLILFVDVLQTVDEKVNKIDDKLKDISERDTEIMNAFEVQDKLNETFTKAIKYLDETKSNKRKSKKKTEEE